MGSAPRLKNGFFIKGERFKAATCMEHHSPDSSCHSARELGRYGETDTSVWPPPAKSSKRSRAGGYRVRNSVPSPIIPPKPVSPHGSCGTRPHSDFGFVPRAGSTRQAARNIESLLT